MKGRRGVEATKNEGDRAGGGEGTRKSSGAATLKTEVKAEGSELATREKPLSKHICNLYGSD